MPKRPKMCHSIPLLHHTFFPRDFSGNVDRNIADRDIINAPLEPIRPTDVPFWGFR